MTGVKSKALIRDIGQKKNITIWEMFDLAHEHADGEDTINDSNGKYNPRIANNADPCSSSKRDHKRRGDFVANVEKRRGNNQKENNRDKFDKITNSPCQNHGFPVTHLAKE